MEKISLFYNEFVVGFPAPHRSACADDRAGDPVRGRGRVHRVGLRGAVSAVFSRRLGIARPRGPAARAPVPSALPVPLPVPSPDAEIRLPA